MQAKKTHEQQLRTLERRPDMAKAGDPSSPEMTDLPTKLPKDHDAGDFPVTRQGAHQESRHNKHNEAGQGGHKPQR